MREKKRKEEKKKKEKMGIDWLNRLPFNLSNLDLTAVDTLGQVNLFGEGGGILGSFSSVERQCSCH